MRQSVFLIINPMSSDDRTLSTGTATAPTNVSFVPSGYGFALSLGGSRTTGRLASFKNWVKEYEAGDIYANPADFRPSADADDEADPDPDHEPDQDPDTSVSSAAQFTAGPYIANEQPQNGNGNGASAGPSHSNNGQFSSTPPVGPVPPPIAAPQAFSQFNFPQEAGDVAANAEEQKVEETGAVGTNGKVNANANANAPNAAGFPPMYPLVYPPVESEQKEGV
ncbi:hypothetical protein FRC06_008502 [Ceratobasidium sp. 370]|nr:hypothetical protein FRC06_008502 [Ceratobasidium sp. 370]